MSNFLGALRGMFFYLTNKTYSFPGFSSTSYGFTWCSRELRSPSKTPKASLSSNAFGTAVNHHVPSFSFIKKLSTCALHIHIYIYMYTFLHLGIRCECKYIYILLVLCILTIFPSYYTYRYIRSAYLLLRHCRRIDTGDLCICLPSGEKHHVPCASWSHFNCCPCSS